MEREKVWDLYFAKLHELLVRERARIEQLIREEAGNEISKRWKDISWEGIEAYIRAAVSFIEERLYAYGLDSLDRFLKFVTHGISSEDLASIDDSLTWYDCKQEKAQIDAKIETGLNIMQPPEDIVDDLFDEFGAFPNKSIIQHYQLKPEKNYLPDYALGIAIQQVISERRS